MTSATPPTQPSPARELLRLLQDSFAPFKAFQPLAIGIDAAIQERMPEVDRKTLRTALRLHTHSMRYLKAMEKATARLDLDGNPAGEVTEDQRKHATDILKERFKKAATERRAREAEVRAREAEEAETRRKAEKLQQLAARFAKNKD